MPKAINVSKYTKALCESYSKHWILQPVLGNSKRKTIICSVSILLKVGWRRWISIVIEIVVNSNMACYVKHYFNKISEISIVISI